MSKCKKTLSYKNNLQTQPVSAIILSLLIAVKQNASENCKALDCNDRLDCRTEVCQQTYKNKGLKVSPACVDSQQAGGVGLANLPANNTNCKHPKKDRTTVQGLG